MRIPKFISNSALIAFVGSLAAIAYLFTSHFKPYDQYHSRVFVSPDRCTEAFLSGQEESGISADLIASSAFSATLGILENGSRKNGDFEAQPNIGVYMVGVEAEIFIPMVQCMYVLSFSDFHDSFSASATRFLEDLFNCAFPCKYFNLTELQNAAAVSIIDVRHKPDGLIDFDFLCTLGKNSNDNYFVHLDVSGRSAGVNWSGRTGSTSEVSNCSSKDWRRSLHINDLSFQAGNEIVIWPTYVSAKVSKRKEFLAWIWGL